MEIRQFVKAKRKQYHLTQVALAESAGVGLRFVRELESGKPTLRIDKVNAVLDLFGARLGPVPVERQPLETIDAIEDAQNA
jgi:y4mF family transcriptional regulator